MFETYMSIFKDFIPIVFPLLVLTIIFDFVYTLIFGKGGV